MKINPNLDFQVENPNLYLFVKLIRLDLGLEL